MKNFDPDFSPRQPAAWSLAFGMGACLIGPSAQAADPAPEPAKPEETPAVEKAAPDEANLKNWFDLSVGLSAVDGNKAEFSRRYSIPRGVFGGVESFHFEQELFEGKAAFKVDGRGIFDDHDYNLKFELDFPEKGFVRAGYREFRSFYDGTAGFFPPSETFFRPEHRVLELDRGELFFEAGLRLENVPKMTFRYARTSREGEKDTTLWGDATMPTLPPAPTNLRAIMPGFLEIDEKKHTFRADVEHTLGNTDFGVGVSYEIGEVDNTKKLQREVPVPPLTTQQDEVDTDLFNAHAFTRTRFTDKLVFTSGYSFTTLDTDLGGNRIGGFTYDADFAPLAANRGFLDLNGGSQMDQHVVALNLMWLLTDHLTLVPSIRAERRDIDSHSTFTYTQPSPPITTFQEAESERGLVDLAERLELRYTRFKNLSLYARGDWAQGEGDLEEALASAIPSMNLVRETDDTRNVQKYTAGANWYPLKKLNFGAQYYHKIRDHEYDHDVDNSNSAGLGSAGRYPAFLTNQDYSTDDVNLRVTWRALNNLTFISRYDYQMTEIDTDFSSTNAAFDEQETADVESHIFSESVTWVPLSRLYLQASINYAIDRTETPAEAATGGAVLDAENSYWNASFAGGYALSDKTDLDARYLYYQADNYDQDKAQFGLPLGASSKEHGVTATLTHRFRPQLIGMLRYGFFTNSDQTYGGQKDYDAHLVYSSLRYRF